ncbi:MAG TPA: MFS transporter, partial [Myxococcota bacterium]|nr:MFS transporter [Myxococcota bacterium]
MWWALPTRLRAAEIPIAEITALSALLTIPWSAKFLWAPLVDAMRPRRAGLRGWIAGAQLVMGASLLPIVGLELDAGSLGTLSTFLLVHAFAAATQDVAIDALAIRHTPTDELGAISGWMQVGMLTGRAAFG